jgi:hypothetical protein
MLGEVLGDVPFIRTDSGRELHEVGPTGWWDSCRICTDFWAVRDFERNSNFCYIRWELSTKGVCEAPANFGKVWPGGSCDLACETLATGRD